MRFVKAIVAAIVIAIATPVAVWAGSHTVSVPAGTAAVTVGTVSINNSTGAGTVTSTTTFAPSTSTVTVNLPNNTPSTSYGASLTFADAAGNLISQVNIEQQDSGGGGETKN